ncbi:MAG: twin-arginine translocase subunit TatC [Candidatus Aminicenantes bacterium]|nr:twin-arginine translocase subunit TatC [Candidatus Aminicenantes bacterium]
MKEKKADEMSFFEHLGELRKRIVYSLAFVLVFFMASWSIVGRLYRWLSLPVLKFLPPGPTGEAKLAFTALAEPFMMYIKVAFISSLFAASPFIFHQLWLFISPALFPKERRWVVPFVLATTFFFLLGGAFGYFVVFPLACRFFLDIGKDFTAIITINDYFSLAFRVIFGIAVVFELPVLVFLLARLRVVSARFLLKYFKYAIVAIFILAAVITPTPDMITQSLFAGPMILLYLLSIGIAKVAAPRPSEEPEE